MALSVLQRYALVEGDTAPVTLVWDTAPCTASAAPPQQRRAFARSSEAVAWAAAQYTRLDFWHPQLCDSAGNQLTFGVEFDDLVTSPAAPGSMRLTTVA